MRALILALGLMLVPSVVSAHPPVYPYRGPVAGPYIIAPNGRIVGYGYPGPVRVLFGRRAVYLPVVPVDANPYPSGRWIWQPGEYRFHPYNNGNNEGQNENQQRRK